MAEYFAGGHLRFVDGEWRDDNGDVVEIREVKQSEWQKSQFTGRRGFYSLRDYVCSECKIYSTFVQDGIKHPMFYCPNCGAKMGGVVE